MQNEEFNEGLAFPLLPTSSEADSVDWEYTMRRSMQEIIHNIYLGPYSVAGKSKLSYLQQHGITHVVCIRHPVEAKIIKPNFPQQLCYLVLEIVDDPDESIIKYFPQVKEFIDDCLSKKGKVLVHGNAGISRSAALIIAYIMETFGLTYKKAHRYVLQQRYCINPNEGFARQLVEYEPIYLARYQQKKQERDGSSSNNGVFKRQFHIAMEDDSDDENERNKRKNLSGDG